MLNAGMQDKPLVSVLVPTFNDGSMLIEALESLRRQTYDEFEAIVCDDASSNETSILAAEWCKSDPRFRLVRNPQNLGMTRNWNRVLSEARGDYLAKLDGDDAFQPQTLERMVDGLQRHRAEIGFCRTIECDDSLRPVSSYYGERAFILARMEPLAEHLQPGHFWYRLSFDDFQLWHSNAFLVSRRVMASISGWDVRWGCASDTDLILRLLELNLAVVHVPYAGVLYRKRLGSVSDQYRKRCWLIVEGSTIHLLSLERYRVMGGIFNTRLRRNWYRAWQNWHTSIEIIRQEVSGTDRLEALEVAIGSPPTCIQIEGYIHQKLWAVGKILAKKPILARPEIT